jgi:hypothetical protein
MFALLRRLSPALHLTRVTTAFAGIANIWFVVLWTRAASPEFEPATHELRSRPLWVLLVGGAIVALGLFSYGMAMNDVLDLRRDRALRPDRPIPAGRMPLEAAVAVVIGSLLAAVLGSTVFGIASVVLTLVVAMAVLLFNATARFIPALGLVTLGLIYAGHMFIPNIHLRFTWPVWLVMTHALALGAVTHVVAGKTPPVSMRALVAAVAGWAFWSAALLALAARHDPGSQPWPAWVHQSVALWPALLAVVFILFVARRLQQFGVGARAAEKIGRYGSLWIALYGCSWLVGHGAWPQAWVLIALTAAGFLGMTVLRELYAFIEQPLTFRRA